MALVKGICKNFGECSLADNKEIQEVDKINFVCEECGRPLHSHNSGNSTGKRKGGNKKLIGIIAAATCLLAGLGSGAYFLFSNKGKVPTAITIDKTTLTMNVGDKELITPSVEPKEAKATFVFKKKGNNVQVTNGGEITALKKGEATILVKCEENPEIRAICKVTVNEDEKGPIGGDNDKPTVFVEKLSIDGGDFILKEGESKQLSGIVVPEKHDELLAWSSDNEAIATVDNSGKVTAVKSGTANIKVVADKSGVFASVKVTVKKEATGGIGGRSLKWGVYEGAMSNGVPHGNGVLRITRSTTINGETAQPGERIEGVFRNGYVNLGTWYKKDGNAVVVKDIKVI